MGSSETLHAPCSELVFSFEPLDSGVWAGSCGEAWGTVFSAPHVLARCMDSQPPGCASTPAKPAAAEWVLWPRVSRLIR